MHKIALACFHKDGVTWLEVELWMFFVELKFGIVKTCVNRFLAFLDGVLHRIGSSVMRDVSNTVNGLHRYPVQRHIEAVYTVLRAGREVPGKSTAEPRS